MVIIRPVQSSDLDQLEQLASLAGVGLTTLPKDRIVLATRIARSEASFAKIPDHPAGESYLLVMEDLDKHAIVGACGIVSKVGGFQPFYAYKIEKSLFESKAINVRKEVPILSLFEEHDGPSVACFCIRITGTAATGGCFNWCDSCSSPSIVMRLNRRSSAKSAA